MEHGMENYHLSDARIVLGDWDNILPVNTIILITKKVIHNAMKKQQIPNILNVKSDTKNFYYEGKIQELC